MRQFLFICLASVLGLSSCVIIQPYEVAVRQQRGKLDDKIYTEGRYSAFRGNYTTLPLRVTNLKITLDIPSKEGLTINSEMSILYRIEKEKALDIIRYVGPNYEQDLISPVFRSALADASAQFNAKDMHSGKRAEIEESVKSQMTKVLRDRGFIIEAVLMKRISLPKGLSVAIEDRLEAEQDAQQMQFTLQKQRQEAERLVVQAEGRKKVVIIEAEAQKEQKLIDAEGDKQASILRAEGTKKANEMINKGLTPELLRLRTIEAFEKLSTSENSKMIITDGSDQILNLDYKK